MLPSWYILSLKPNGKGDCKNLIHSVSVSCLFIFFNLVDEYGSYIIFFNRLNYYFTMWMTITFEMAIKKCVNFFRLFQFTKVLTKPSLKGSASLSNIFHSTNQIKYVVSNIYIIINFQFWRKSLQIFRKCSKHDIFCSCNISLILMIATMRYLSSYPVPYICRMEVSDSLFSTMITFILIYCLHFTHMYCLHFTYIVNANAFQIKYGQYSSAI